MKKSSCQKNFFIEKNYKNFNIMHFKRGVLLKSLIPSSSTSSTFLGKIKDGETAFAIAYHITKTFYDYFSNIGHKLSDKIISTDKNFFRNYLSPSVLSSLFFNPASPFEVKKQTQLLKNSKSCGHDNISTTFFEVTADILAARLTGLFNFSLKYGIFPDCLKTAKIIPIFKQSNKLEVSNYRPISILTTFF